jgi:hypothetical protein
MQCTVFLAHGMFGPFDELLALILAGLFAALLVISLVVQRRQPQSFSPHDSGEQKSSLGKVESNVGHEHVTRVWLD